MKVYTLNGCEYWYDRQYRCWYAAHADKDGNLGESINAYSKREIIFLIKRGDCKPFNGFWEAM